MSQRLYMKTDFQMKTSRSHKIQNSSPFASLMKARDFKNSQKLPSIIATNPFLFISVFILLSVCTHIVWAVVLSQHIALVICLSTLLCIEGGLVKQHAALLTCCYFTAEGTVATKSQNCGCGLLKIWVQKQNEGLVCSFFPTLPPKPQLTAELRCEIANVTDRSFHFHLRCICIWGHHLWGQPACFSTLQ